MKNKIISVEFIVLIVFIFVIGNSALIFLNAHNTPLNDTKNSSNSSKPIPKVNVSEIIENIRKENKNLELVYESSNIKDLKSLIYHDNNRYKNILINTINGEVISVADLFVDWDLFKQKEQDLLKLKYPEFIAQELITNSTNLGTKDYLVKDNEIVIYYYDYSFLYEYTEPVSVKINYNEVKDNLVYFPILDATYENEDGYNYTPDKKSIALTFDDGPSRKYNSLILEELAKNKAHATFFMVGSMMESCGKCIVDTYNSGNEVASHTYEHLNIKNNSVEKVNDSLKKVNDIYYNLTGDNIKYLRPPYGAYNKTNLENINVPLILWNLDTEDWRYRDVDHIVNYIIENAHDGGIILMHELYETSYEALKIALPKLYAMGYQVVSVGELATLQNRTLEVGNCYKSLT